MSCLTERSSQQLQIPDGPTASTPGCSSSAPPTRPTANSSSTVQSTAVSTVSNYLLFLFFCVCDGKKSLGLKFDPLHLPVFTISWFAQE